MPGREDGPLEIAAGLRAIHAAQLANGRYPADRLLEAADQLEQPRLTEDERKVLREIAQGIRTDSYVASEKMSGQAIAFLRNLAGDNQ